MTPKRTTSKTKPQADSGTSTTKTTRKSSAKKAASATATTKKRTTAKTKKTTTKTAKSPAQKTTPAKTKKQQPSADKVFAVVRVRGINNVRKEINDTLSLMNLKRINNLTFVDNRPSYKGMIQKAKDYITWGEPDPEIVTQLFQKWARVTGDHPLTDDYIKKNSSYKSIKDFVNAFLSLKAELKDINGLKPFFRLHPPKGGHRGRGIKYAYTAGGALGYRGENINELIKQMAGI